MKLLIESESSYLSKSILKSPNKKLFLEDSFCSFNNNGEIKSLLKSFIWSVGVVYKRSNNPQPARTSRNKSERSRTTRNEQEQSRTIKNNPKQIWMGAGRNHQTFFRLKTSLASLFLVLLNLRLRESISRGYTINSR